jgi:uncharacterized protein
MTETPLFPLHLVLFPKIPLRLRIFEPRYQLMLADCVKNMQPFGVLLIKTGLEIGTDPVSTYNTGVTAQITRIDPQKKGVTLITAIGLERFRVSSFNHDKAYLGGNIELSPLKFTEQTQLDFSYLAMHREVNKYLEIVHQASRKKKPFNQPKLPPNLEPLAFLAASILQIPPHEKQTLLELDNHITFLQEVRRLLRREITVYSHLRPGSNSRGKGKRN